MKMEHLVVTAALTVAASACAGIKVSSDWDPSADFSQYQTFAVMDEAPGSAQLDQLIRGRIKAAIATTLQAKGMSQVDSPDDADLAVGWQLTTEERSSFQTVSTGWGGYGRYGRAGWYGAGAGMATSRTTETRYDVGTLVIALFDETKDQMIFTGTGSKELAATNLTPQESQKRINEAVAAILKDYPPGG